MHCCAKEPLFLQCQCPVEKLLKSSAQAADFYFNQAMGIGTGANSSFFFFFILMGMRILFISEVLLKKMVKTCFIYGEEEKRTKKFYLQFKLPFMKLNDFTSKACLQRLGDSSPASDKNFPKYTLHIIKKNQIFQYFPVFSGDG